MSERLLSAELRAFVGANDAVLADLGAGRNERDAYRRTIEGFEAAVKKLERQAAMLALVAQAPELPLSEELGEMQRAIFDCREDGVLDDLAANARHLELTVRAQAQDIERLARELAALDAAREARIDRDRSSVIASREAARAGAAQGVVIDLCEILAREQAARGVGEAYRVAGVGDLDNEPEGAA
jgi:hypothetical protein